MVCFPVCVYSWNHVKNVQTTFLSAILSDSTRENEMAIQDKISHLPQTPQIHWNCLSNKIKGSQTEGKYFQDNRNKLSQSSPQ